MKLRETGIALTTLALGFFLGRSSTPGAAGVPEVANVNGTPRGRSTSPEHSATGSTARHGPRSASAANAGSEDGPRVSLALADIQKTLKDRFKDSDIIADDEQLSVSLTLLGATPDERQAAAEMMKRTRQEILREQQAHIKVTRADASLITLELTGMAAPLERIAGRTRDHLRSILPPAVAEPLIESVDWDKLRDQQLRSTEGPTSFQLILSANGHLSAHWSRPDGSTTTTSSTLGDQYPNDGSPAPANAFVVFPELWKSALEGRMLQPVEQAAPDPGLK